VTAAVQAAPERTQLRRVLITDPTINHDWE